MSRLVTTLILFLSLIVGVHAQITELSLEECIQIAFKGNSTIRINRNLNEIADEEVEGSYSGISGILPRINLSASTGRIEGGIKETEGDVPIGVDDDGNYIYERRIINQPGFTTNENRMGLSVNQMVFNGGEWWNAISYAKSQKKVSDKSLHSIVNSTILEVQQKFYDLLKAEKLLEVNEQAVQRSQDQLNKTQKMFELGAVAKVDVYRSRVNLGNDKISMLLQKNAIILAKNNLNIVMGRDPKTPIEITTEGLEINPVYSGTEDYVAQGLEKNPGIKQNEEQVNSQSIQASRAYGVLWPEISVFFDYSRRHEGLRQVYRDWNKNWTMYYGVSLRFNIFNGLQDKVRIQISKLEERNAMETYKESKRILRATIAQYINDFNSYIEIIDINEDNLEAAKEEYRLAEERYRIGSGTQLEVREAQVNLTGAEEILVRAKYSALVTQAQLDNALGMIYVEAEEKSE